MNDPVVAVILCAGQATRFGGVVKQLLEIDGAPLVQRTLNQCAARGIPTWLITHQPEVYEEAGIRARFFEPRGHRWTCETLYSTRDLWGTEQTIVLLGDVYYSDFCMDLLVKGETMFYTGEAEIWGMAIRRQYYDRAGKTLRRVLDLAAKRQDAEEHHCGQLWRYYRVWYGLAYIGDWKITPGLAFQRAGTTRVVFDETVDFDVPVTYERWQAGLRGRQVWWNAFRPGTSPGLPLWCEWLKGLRWEGEKWRCPKDGKLHSGFKGCAPATCKYYDITKGG